MKGDSSLEFCNVENITIELDIKDSTGSSETSSLIELHIEEVKIASSSSQESENNSNSINEKSSDEEDKKSYRNIISSRYTKINKDSSKKDSSTLLVKSISPTEDRIKLEKLKGLLSDLEKVYAEKNEPNSLYIPPFKRTPETKQLCQRSKTENINSVQEHKAEKTKDIKEQNINIESGYFKNLSQFRVTKQQSDTTNSISKTTEKIEQWPRKKNIEDIIRSRSYSGGLKKDTPILTRACQRSRADSGNWRSHNSKENIFNSNTRDFPRF